MRPGNVPCRQYLHPTPTILTDDLLGPLVYFSGNDRVGGDQLLCQVEIISGLAFVIGEDETVIALRAGQTSSRYSAARIRSEVFQFFFALPQTARLYRGLSPSKV